MPVVASLGSLLDELRAGTRKTHAMMERIPAFGRLLAPDLTRAEYEQTLVRLHRFHAGLDGALSPVLAVHASTFRFAESERTRALLADLAWLGVGPLPPVTRRSLPRLGNFEAALGCLYVVEGSSLGGRLIARRLRDTLGLDACAGARFFGGAGAEEVRRRWLALCRMLETMAAMLPDAGRRRVVAGALDTFDSLASWMMEVDSESEL